MRQVSFAFAAGLVVIAAMIPLNAVLAKRIGVATRELMKHKDDRVQRCSEMLNGVRVGGMATLCRTSVPQCRTVLNLALDVAVPTAAPLTAARCFMFGSSDCAASIAEQYVDFDRGYRKRNVHAARDAERCHMVVLQRL